MPQSLAELRRLVSALEALSAEEHVLLRQRLYDEVNALHLRELPLAARIAELAARPGVRAKLDADLVQRIRTLIHSFESKSQALDEAMVSTQLSLAKLDQSQKQARTLRPAYGRSYGSPIGAFAAEG